MLRRLLLVGFSLAALGCPTEPLVEPPPGGGGRAGLQGVDPGALSGLARLTDAEWRNAAEALSGVRFEGELPPDYDLHGFSSVGAAEITVAPSDFDLYEAAAWSVAEAAVPDAAARQALLGCAVTPPLGAEDTATDDTLCLRSFGAEFLSRAWRRPVGLEEVDRHVALYDDLVEQTGRPDLGLQAVVAAALLAPDFLFRVELGEPIEGDPSRRLLDDHEMAARLSLVLLDQPPSPELSERAAAGMLGSSGDVVDEAVIALGDGAAPAAWQRFFAEWTDLADLELVTKDPGEYPEWSPALVAAMQAEAAALFAGVALERDEDLRTLFVVRDAVLTPDLAALYGVAAPPEPGAEVTLPPERAGLLTRGAFLATRSHATITSPTSRGKYVRTRLLCQDVPPPPEGVVTSLDGVDDSGTLRDLLEHHMTEPACAGCHSQMDPIGFAFEHFDAVGAWRDLDNGLPVDAASDLDGVPVDGGAALGAALAEHPRLPDCVAANAWSHVLGHLRQTTERDELDGVEAAFESGGYRLGALVEALAATEAFRTVATPEGGACAAEQEGTTRPCSTACGEGDEVCRAGTWSDCTADRPGYERCNGVDDDCDGEVDDGVVMACTVGGARGLDSCSDGQWSGCEVSPPPETCNGLDDDGDGVVDEDLEVDLRTTPYEQVTAGHEACVPSAASHSPACRAAVHRTCSATGCASTGIGPVALDPVGQQAALACLAPSEAVIQHTTYTELGTFHPACSVANRFGPDCNASINRFCASIGQVTGYGPVENSGDAAVVACNPTATTYETTYTELTQHVEQCSAGGERMGPHCDEAFHRFCRALGHRTGHGPLENSGDIAYAACIGSLP